MTGEFLRQQEQLLSSAQAHDGRQLADPPQPALAGNPLGARLVKCEPESHHKVVLQRSEMHQVSPGSGPPPEAS